MDSKCFLLTHDLSCLNIIIYSTGSVFQWFHCRVFPSVCVCCLLMVSSASESCLFLHSLAFFLFFFFLWCLEPQPAIQCVKGKKKGDHLMCVWLCLIKLMGGEEWREGSGRGRLNLKRGARSRSLRSAHLALLLRFSP